MVGISCWSKLCATNKKLGTFELADEVALLVYGVQRGRVGHC